MLPTVLRIALLIVAPLPAGAADIDGPVAAVVERVVDGDTLHVRARVWIGQEVATAVRLRGIDAPELRARCEAERLAAEAARDFLSARIGEGRVLLTAIGGGKYFGRVLADVADGEGRDLAAALLAAGHARPYDGGRRESWCGDDVAGR